MKTRAIVVLVIIALVSTMTSLTAVAQEAEQTQLLEELDLTLEEIQAIDPNRAWDSLGLFSDDALRVLGAATEAADFNSYAFGDDPTQAPVINPSGSTPTGFGRMLWDLPADWTPPAEGLTDSMAYVETPTSRLQGGDTVVLMWAEMDSDFDFTSGLTINEGFPLTVPNRPVWNSTFAGDTWEGANVIPNAVYDGVDLTLDVKGFEAPQSFPLLDLGGFYYRAGNIMAIAVSADGLASLAGATPQPAATTDTGANQTLLFTGDGATITTQFEGFGFFLDIVFRVYSHLAGDLFTAGNIFLSGLLLMTILIIVASSLELADLDQSESDLVEGLADEVLDSLEGEEPDDVADEPAVVDEPPESEPVATDTTTTATTDSGDDGLPVGILVALLGIVILAIGILISGILRRDNDGYGDDDDEDDEQEEDDDDDDEYSRDRARQRRRRGRRRRMGDLFGKD